MLYIDIDIHHGDGVELAFYQSNRVMTVSFHKYTGDFFPGTGKLDDNGNGSGKHFCLNVPLQDGIDDDMYLTIFKTVIDDTVTAFRPSSIVLQCGADSLGCDRLGAFNLSIAAHGECVNFVRKYNVPLLVVGGGGYTIKNVSRCWTYETAVLVGATISDDLPATVYDSFFADSRWKLHPPLTGKVDNQNSPASLQRITTSIRTKLRYLQGAPSIAMQEIPPDIQGFLWDEERSAEERDEERGTRYAGEERSDRSMARNEYFDGDGDVDQDEGSVVTRVTRTTRGGKGNRGKGRGGQSVSASSTVIRPNLTEEEDGEQVEKEEDGEQDDEEDIGNSVVQPTKKGGKRVGAGRKKAKGKGKGNESYHS